MRDQCKTAQCAVATTNGNGVRGYLQANGSAANRSVDSAGGAYAVHSRPVTDSRGIPSYVCCDSNGTRPNVGVNPTLDCDDELLQCMQLQQSNHPVNQDSISSERHKQEPIHHRMILGSSDDGHLCQFNALV